MSAPLRKIVHSTASERRLGRRGFVSLSTLECGHQDWTKASERRRGATYCFDCHYAKPAHAQGLITLQQIAGV